jgi:hypothetical protein
MDQAAAGKANGRRAKRVKRMGVPFDGAQGTMSAVEWWGPIRADTRLAADVDYSAAGKAKGRRAKRVMRVGVGPHAQ